MKIDKNTTSDLISRQAAIEALDIPDYENGEAYLQYVNDKRAIELVSSAQPEQRWIPCSERLPEEGGWYIVTVNTEAEYDVCLRWYSKLHGWEWDEQDNTIAWMPLPEPWKGEEV